MTPERIAELRRLADAATKGPWEAKDDYPEVKIVSDYQVEGAGEVANWIATVDDSPDFGDDEAEVAERNQANGLFIAAARSAVPELLDALEARDAEIESLKGLSEAAIKALSDVAVQLAELKARLEVAGRTWNRMLEADSKGMGNPFAKVEAMREINDLLNGRGSVRSAVVEENAALRARVERLEKAKEAAK